MRRCIFLPSNQRIITLDVIRPLPLVHTERVSSTSRNVTSWKPLLSVGVFTHTLHHCANNGEFSIFRAVLRSNALCGRGLRMELQNNLWRRYPERELVLGVGPRAELEGAARVALLRQRSARRLEAVLKRQEKMHCVFSK